MTAVISATPPLWMTPDVTKWLGPRRYFYQPNCDHPVHSVAIVSSRLARPLYEQTDWFAKIRQVLECCQKNNDVILTAKKTTTYKFLHAYAEKYRLRLATTSICSTPKQWQARITNRNFLQPLECWISPPAEIQTEGNHLLERLPLRDRLLFGGAHEVQVIDCRDNSKTQQLLNLRKHEIHFCELPASLNTKSPSDNVSSHTNKSSIPWWVGQAGTLAHWTRAIDGPWPQQSETSWYNQLIQGQREADHSAWATLNNIVTQQKILASHRTIRGSYKVVCLTAVALDQWKSLNIYRPHLRRWDFCPYGVLLSPSAVARLQVKKVHYGDEQLWNSLTSSARPFFQAIDCKIDWRAEKEYRLIGDLSLSTFNRNDLVVFTQTGAEATALQTHCSWPVQTFEYLAKLARIQT
ncbi:MAG: hypothetical protein CMJ76_17400 [Planctomycetaceae bacterium]|nr:hypothetical protein [Planctomycetaceae bacterium]